MGDQLEFKVSENLVLPIIKEKINAAVVEALGGHDEIVSSMMTAFMSQKVDYKGNPSENSYNNEPRLHYLAHKMVEDALTESLQAYMKTKTEFMQKEFEKFFNSKKGSSLVVKAMQEGFCDALKDKWRLSIQFKIPEK